MVKQDQLPLLVKILIKFVDCWISHKKNHELQNYINLDPNLTEKKR